MLTATRNCPSDSFKALNILIHFGLLKNCIGNAFLQNSIFNFRMLILSRVEFRKRSTNANLYLNIMVLRSK